jgi:hypothetical protein
MLVTIPVIKQYKTPDNAELRDTLKVDEKYYQVLKLNIPTTVKAGDSFQLLVEAHVTNNLCQDLKVDLQKSLVYITPVLRAYPLDPSTKAYKITEASGQNFDGRIHHFRVVTVGSWVCPVDMPGGVLFVLELKSGSSNAKANWKLDVDKGQGTMSVQHVSSYPISVDNPVS